MEFKITSVEPNRILFKSEDETSLILHFHDSNQQALKSIGENFKVDDTWEFNMEPAHEEVEEEQDHPEEKDEEGKPKKVKVKVKRKKTKK